MEVKCPKCNTDNPSDSKYCREWATPLPSTKEDVFEQIVGFTLSEQYIIAKSLIMTLVEKTRFF